MTNHRQEYLKYLFEKGRLDSDEKEWMYNYLDQNELSELKTIAAEEYNMDVVTYNNVHNIKLSVEILNRIHKRIETPKSFAEQILRFRWMKYTVAACVVLMVGLGYLFFDRVMSAQFVQHERTTANERKTFKLPDGSLVSLEPGSSLEYPNKFNGETREVFLKGEAFFEITKDTIHPFIIHTKQINTTVLGTSFNIEAYDSKEPRVVVVTGKVKVQTDNGNKQVQVLSPNESVEYSSKTGGLVKREALDDALYYKYRRTGKFIYKGEKLYKVVEDVQRYYKTKISIEGNVNACLFYGDLFSDDKLEKTLSLIATSLNASIKKENKSENYLIVGGGCK